MKDKLAKLDIHAVVILVLVLASTGHVGQLFAERESADWGVLGYVMALGIESVSVISLYQMAMSSGRKRIVPLVVFLAVCGLLASLNTQYYRQNKPSDPLWFSIILGVSLSVLAALMSALRALKVGTVAETQRQQEESERRQELDHLQAMERIRLEAETERRIAETTAKEKRLLRNADVRLARIQETQRQAQEAKAQDAETRRRQIESLGVYRATFDYYRESPHSDRATAAMDLGVSERTITSHLKHLERLELIRRNGSGSGVEVVVEIPSSP